MKQLTLPGIELKPTSRMIREYVRAEVKHGWEIRQGARQQKRTERNRKALSAAQGR